MRNFCLIIFALFASFHASAALSPADQKLADMLLSGELRQLKSAAQRIEDREISDPQLLDIAAEILIKKYPDAYASEIDTVAWVARAIGASENRRYYDVLSTVVENANHKKLARHAEKALDNIGYAEGEQYVAGMYTLPSGLYEREDDATRDQRIMSLLLSGDLSSLKRGAREIIGTNAQSQELTDTVAEILLTHYATADKHQIDTFAWLANAIGHSGSGRYVDAMTEIEENSEYRKLRKYAEKALDQLSSANVEQYKKGMLGKDIPRYTY